MSKISLQTRQVSLFVAPTLVTISFLLAATLFKFEHGFYNLLRLVVCMTAISYAITARPTKYYIERWLFIFVALIFNPISIISFDRDVWEVLDVITAGLFGYYFLKNWLSRWQVAAVLIIIFIGLIPLSMVIEKVKESVEEEDRQNSKKQFYWNIYSRMPGAKENIEDMESPNQRFDYAKMEKYMSYMDRLTFFHVYATDEERKELVHITGAKDLSSAIEKRLEQIPPNNE